MSPPPTRGLHPRCLLRAECSGKIHVIWGIEITIHAIGDVE
jgi:hypothetical protein